MKITEQECNRIWQMTNAFQQQMLERLPKHLEAANTLGEKYRIQWLKERIEEYDLLETIKTKMIVLELTTDTETDVVEKVEK